MAAAAAELMISCHGPWLIWRCQSVLPGLGRNETETAWKRLWT